MNDPINRRTFFREGLRRLLESVGQGVEVPPVHKSPRPAPRTSPPPTTTPTSPGVPASKGGASPASRTIPVRPAPAGTVPSQRRGGDGPDAAPPGDRA